MLTAAALRGGCAGSWDRPQLRIDWDRAATVRSRYNSVTANEARMASIWRGAPERAPSLG